MNTGLNYVIKKTIGLERKASLFHFCKDFKIDINSNLDTETNWLTSNFAYFLIKNKTLILMYEQDYYEDKTIEIIAKRIGRQKEEIEKYFKNYPFRIDPKYPYRYISSYKVFYEIEGKCGFLQYDKNYSYKNLYLGK